MVVDKIRLEQHADHCQVTARVRRESGPGGESELWFRFPKRPAEELAAEADPFFAALLLPAMSMGERLLIEGSVAPDLVKNSALIQDLFATWIPKARRIPTEVAPRAPHVELGCRGAGLFFSGGVDSFYSLLKNAEAITHLLLIDRLDSKQMSSPAICRDTRERAALVAARLGKQLLIVETNARDLFVPAVVDWSHYHGAVLAAIGLMLRPVLGRVFIAATHSYDFLRPWGSSPLLDPLWSTDATCFVHDGAEATRVEKITNRICRSELALENLRVCLSKDDRYNCGRCEKCMRTMIPIYVAGFLQQCPVFPHVLPVQEAARHKYHNEGYIRYALQNIALLQQKPDQSALDRQLIRAIETAIRHSRKKLARHQRKKSRRRRTWRDWFPGWVRI